MVEDFETYKKDKYLRLNNQLDRVETVEDNIWASAAVHRSVPLADVDVDIILRKKGITDNNLEIT